MKNNKIQYVSNDNFNSLSIKTIIVSLKKISTRKKVINIAISGGSTPIPILKKLREANLEWHKFNFFLVDERVVKVTSNESNYKNINEVFYQYISSKSFLVLEEGIDLDKMLQKYKKQIQKNVPFDKSNTPKFDLIILGMGNDGHTASLFPETNALSENEEFVVSNFVPQLKSYRVTLTYPVLLNADETIVLIKGEEKIKIFNEIINGKGDKYPISKLINSNLHWIIGS